MFLMDYWKNGGLGQMNEKLVYNNNVTLGILAGMGPYSTAPFLNYVLDACKRLYSATNDTDFPDIVIYSLPTPYQLKLQTSKLEIIDRLKLGIETLCNANVSIIAVPCNSIHRFYQEMTELSSVPILNIIQETVNKIEKNVKYVGILATRATVISGLYQDKLQEKNICSFWNEQLQEEVDALVSNFKTKGIDKVTIDNWRKIENFLEQNSIKNVIIGCTDLAFCTNLATKNICIYDSSLILAESLVKHYMQLVAEECKL